MLNYSLASETLKVMAGWDLDSDLGMTTREHFCLVCETGVRAREEVLFLKDSTTI